MVEVLKYVAEQLESASIPYAYGEWMDTVTYPYFVGNYDESEWRYEDNFSGGTFTIDGWSRGSSAKMQLKSAADRIKELFADNIACIESDWEWDPFYFPYGKVEDTASAYFIRYGGTQSIPSGEEGLYRIQITLFVNEWKGE